VFGTLLRAFAIRRAKSDWPDFARNLKVGRFLHVRKSLDALHNPAGVGSPKLLENVEVARQSNKRYKGALVSRQGFVSC
jgi:hypothetical protein